MWSEFFKKLEEVRNSGRSFAVATVVKVSGSTYRRPGARVLITEDGTATGLISGGCFESDLIERAKDAIRIKQAVTVTFDTTSPDDLLFGLGLGCAGVANILIEPHRGHANQDYLNFLSTCVNGNRSGALATIFGVKGKPGFPIGTHMMVLSDKEFSGNVDDAEMQKQILQLCLGALETESMRVTKLESGDGFLDVLIEVISLPVTLLIFGAGPDAVPVVRFAKNLGWNVRVIDRRPAYARSERFPAADAVLLIEPEDLMNEVSIDSRTVAVIMTHHFETDLNYLKYLLPSHASYIGLLGPQAKADMLFQALRDRNVVPTKEELLRVYSPVGLDLGCETPEEIALAIVGEIQAVRSGYTAGFLRERKGPIHRRMGK